jgi:hypothetical protein
MERRICLCRSKLSLLDNIQQMLGVDPGTTAYDILLVELCVEGSIRMVPFAASSRQGVLGALSVRKEFRRNTRSRIFKQHVAHRKIGGLTMSTTMFSWAGEGGESVRLGGGKYPMRPVDKCVEVAAEIPRGRSVHDVVQKEVFWRAGDNLPFNWPPPQWPVLVQVPSVFRKGEMAARHLTPKEACQLLDIPGGWHGVVPKMV